MEHYLPKGEPKGGGHRGFALPGFDREAWMASEAGKNVGAMKAIAKQYPEDEMADGVLKYWAENGVKKELFDAQGEGKYAVFTPLDLDVRKKYALVYLNHAGMTPINQYETCGFPMLAGKEKFICVCPWNGGPSNDQVETEFPRILDALKERGFPIDWERVYVAGFSAGSDATGVLTWAYADRIAAISPSPGANMFLKGRWYETPDAWNGSHPMPMICVAGTMDGGDRYPLDTQEGIDNYNIWMKQIVKVPDYEALTLEASQALGSQSDDPAKQTFGMDFHNTYTLHMEGRRWYVGEYRSEGVAYARFIMGDGIPHTQTKYHAPLIWDFLKHFRRDTRTGETVYMPVVIDGIRDMDD